MAGSEDTLFTWSVAARTDFRAVTDDGTCSDRFRLALAATIAQGWDNNRDKPAWALAALLRALDSSGAGLATCLDLIWHAPAELLATLGAGAGGTSGIGRNADGTLYLKDRRGSFRLSAFRLRLLQKLLEFTVSCDDFTHGASVVATLDPLCNGAGESEVSEATRSIARLLYRYRETHFDDARANTSFTVIRAYMKDAGDVIDDDTPFAFWVSPGNSLFRTYAASFFGLRDYADTLAAAVARAAMEQGCDASDPALQAALSVAPEDPFAEEADAEGIAAALSEAPAAPESAEAALKAIAEGELRIVSQKQRAFLAPVMQAGRFGIRLPHATARLLAFHPIQSALSNSLRTGKATLPVAERVHCAEATSYAGLVDHMQSLETAMTDWMTIALALRIGDDAADDRRAGLREAGVRLLKQKRSKSFQRPPEELARAFREIEAGLIAVSTALREMRQALARRFATETDMTAAFEADRARFAAAFARLYLETPADATEA